VSRSCRSCKDWTGHPIAEITAERPQTAGSVKKELVVAHYGENLDWLSGVPECIDRITIYSKGGTVGVVDRRAKVIRLPNVGREAHTFLHHFVDRYDSLAETTFTAQGGALLHAPDLLGLLAMDHLVPTTLSYHYAPDIPSQEIKDLDLTQFVGPYEVRYGLFLHFGSRNPATNLRWFDQAWVNTFECPMPVPYYFGYGAMWALPRRTIMGRSRDFYRSLMSPLLDQGPDYQQFTQPIDAWSIEALWNAIFAGQSVYPSVVK
jgi:hypothetical protein